MGTLLGKRAVIIGIIGVLGFIFIDFIGSERWAVIDYPVIIGK